MNDPLERVKYWSSTNRQGHKDKLFDRQESTLIY